MIDREKIATIKISFVIVVILLIPLFVSILFKRDIYILAEIVLISILFIWYIYINENRLLLFTILGILFTPPLSNINGNLGNLPYFIIVLLCIKLFEKRVILKNKIRFNKIIVFLSLALLIINIFSLIYNQYDINITLIIFYSLKKLCFLVLYLFFINAEVTKTDNKKYLNIIIVFGLLQFLVVAIQFAGGIRRDALGGMFGDSSTGVMIQFMSIILILITTLDEKLNKIPFFDLIIMLLSLIYSALGEVKIGFIIIPFIYFFTLILKKKKAKIIIAIIVLIISFGSIFTLLNTLYPGSDFFSNFSTTESYLQNAYGKNQVNRIGFFPLLKSTILDTTEKQLFGTGLATLNPSKVDSLQGPLFKKYSYLNVHFFALPYSISENGIVGTFIWLMIYVNIFTINVKEYLFNKSEKSIVNIMLVIDIFIFNFYNNSIVVSFSIVLLSWFVISYFNKEEFISE